MSKKEGSLESKIVWISLTCLLIPLLINLPKPVKFGLIALCATHVWSAWTKAEKIKEHWKNLKEIDPLKIDNIPTTPDKIYVGKGFQWENTHTRKLYDLLKTDTKEAEGINEELGGKSYIHGIGKKEEKDIFIPRSEMSGHIMILGTTQVGKTRLFEILITQEIRNGAPIVIIDPKHDDKLLNRVYEEAIKAGREKDILFFSLPHADRSCTYNPLESLSMEDDVADKIAPLLPSGGKSDAFKGFSWGVLSVLTAAMRRCGLKPSLKNLHKYSLNRMGELLEMLLKRVLTEKGIEYEEKDGDLERYLEDLITLYHRNNIVEDTCEDLITQYLHPSEHYQKMISSLNPALRKLTSGEKERLFSSPNSDIKWDLVVNKKKIVYMLLGSLMGGETADIVAKMALHDLTSYIGKKYTYRKGLSLTLFVDEFANVVSDSFVNVLNKAGGAGLKIVLAMQSIADMAANVTRPAVAQQLLDNVNIKIWMRTTDYESAKRLSIMTGETTIQAASSAGSISEGSVNQQERITTSVSQSSLDRLVNLIAPQWIIALPKGQAFMYLQGRIYKLRLPLMKEVKRDYLEDHENIHPEV